MDNLGPSLGGKPLHVFWLLDVSGSMSVAGKIDALNNAMRVAIDSVRDAAHENPTVDVFARSIAFAHDAEWIGAGALDDSTPPGVPISEYVWSDIAVVDQGTTEVGRAIEMATRAIGEVSQSGRGLPPALILVSDGKPTDLKSPSYGAALRALAEHPWGRKASRMAIGIGDDADMEALHQFTGHEELPPLKAANAEDLRCYLRWASTVVVDEGTRPTVDWRERSTEQATGAVPNDVATVATPEAAVVDEPTVAPGTPPPPPSTPPPPSPSTPPSTPSAPPRIVLPPPPPPSENPVW